MRWGRQALRVAHRVLRHRLEPDRERRPPREAVVVRRRPWWWRSCRPQRPFRLGQVDADECDPRGSRGTMGHLRRAADRDRLAAVPDLAWDCSRPPRGVLPGDRCTRGRREPRRALGRRLPVRVREGAVRRSSSGLDVQALGEDEDGPEAVGELVLQLLGDIVDSASSGLIASPRTVPAARARPAGVAWSTSSR